MYICERAFSCLMFSFFTFSMCIVLSLILQSLLFCCCDFLTLITLPNSAITINCTLNLTCDLPSWKINDRLYSSFALANSQAPYSIVDFGNVFFNQIQSEFNGTTLTCFSIKYTSFSQRFFASQGLQTTIIIASSPDKPQIPFYYIMPGCAIRLEWSAPFDNHKPIKYYIISLTENGNTTIINSSSTDIYYSLGNILGGVSYKVSIAAVNIVGTGLFSAPLTIRLPISSPQPLCEIGYVTSDSISLTWTLSYDGTEYQDFTLAFLINYATVDYGKYSILLNETSLLLTSLKHDTMYSINITTFIPGFSNCIFNSSCTLIASTNINPTNYANSFKGNPTFIHILLYIFILFLI